MYGPLGVEIVVSSTLIQCVFWFIILLFVLECYRSAKFDGVEGIEEGRNGEEGVQNAQVLFWKLMKVVWLRLAVNPNSYACILGLVWAIIASRWDLRMPSIVDKSVKVMSNPGTGTTMFFTGMFMALQPKIIACRTKLAVYGMVMKFIAGPVAITVGAIAVGLRGDLLCISIIRCKDI